ncbi:MAG: TetR/AcrR family transcriptional regulator [Ruminococcaceae bacterium]|nr:TetR/AcrR family transcriptional regulator [Oscillospiraceae bacterium]
MVKKNSISVKSKRKITESLLEIMRETSYNKISVKDIVEKAGLTRQTFYHNFKTKEDVIIAELDEYFKDFFKYLIANRVVDIENIICYYFLYWQKNEDFAKLMIKNNLEYVFNDRIPKYFKIMKSFIEANSDLAEVELEYTYAAVCGAITTLLLIWIKNGQEKNPQEMAKFVMEFMYGNTCQKILPSMVLSPQKEFEAMSKD